MKKKKMKKKKKKKKKKIKNSKTKTSPDTRPYVAPRRPKSNSVMDGPMDHRMDQRTDNHNLGASLLPQSLSLLLSFSSSLAPSGRKVYFLSFAFKGCSG